MFTWLVLGIRNKTANKGADAFFGRRPDFDLVVVVYGGKLRSQQEGCLLEEENGGFAFAALLRLASADGCSAPPEPGF